MVMRLNKEALLTKSRRAKRSLPAKNKKAGGKKKVTAKRGGKGTITSQKNGAEEDFQQLVVGKEVEFTQPPANVGVSLSALINLGDYNNIKVSTSLNLPCTLDRIDEAEEFAFKWCEKKMKERIAELRR